MTPTKTTISRSPLETKNLGRALGAKNKKGLILALAGTLGSGKTTFVQGLALGLGLKYRITSPTFVIMAAHQIPRMPGRFYHFDLYRLRRAKDLQDLGFREIVERRQNVIVIEWPQKIKTRLPVSTKWIHFAHDPKHPNNRIIKIH